MTANTHTRAAPTSAPDLLLQDLEAFLASHGDKPMATQSLAVAKDLESDFLEAVAGVVEDMMLQGVPPTTVNAFLAPLLARV